MNINLKKIAWLAIAGVCYSAGVFSADYTMRISHQLPPSHPVAKAVEQFAVDVKTGSAGKLEVQVFGSEQLYKANQNHAAVARGQVEAAVIVSFSWGGTIPEMQLSSIPYLMTSAAKLAKFPSSDAARILNAKFEQKGVKNLAWLVDSNDALFTSSKAPLLRPEDFKGVKIRGLNKLLDNGLIALGASPSAMPGSEVYQALQTGVLDAGITSLDAAYSRRYYEIQKYGVASNYQTVYDNLLVNPAWWAKLPDNLKKVVDEAARKVEAALLPKEDGISPKDVEQLRAKGMIVTTLSPAEVKAIEKVVQPAVIKAFIESGPDAAKLVEIVSAL